MKLDNAGNIFKKIFCHVKLRIEMCAKLYIPLPHYLKASVLCGEFVCVIPGCLIVDLYF